MVNRMARAMPVPTRRGFERVIKFGSLVGKVMVSQQASCIRSRIPVRLRNSSSLGNILRFWKLESLSKGPKS